MGSTESQGGIGLSEDSSKGEDAREEEDWLDEDESDEDFEDEYDPEAS